MVISLGPDSGSEHLRFTAQLEVVDSAAADVTLLMPRILDVLNSYLRAIDTQSIEDPQRHGTAAGADAAAHPDRHRRGPGARSADHRIRAELRGTTWN